MKGRLMLILAGALLLALLPAGGASAAPAAGGVAHTPRLVTSFPAGDFGSFAESMAGDSHGALWVSLTVWGETTNTGQIWKVKPDGTSRLKTSMDLTPYGMLTGLAVDHADRVYVTIDDFSAQYDVTPVIGPSVWRVGAHGTLHKVAALPNAHFPNGLAIHHHRLYVTDSVAGAVWRIRFGHGVARQTTPWLQDARLLPGDPSTDPTKAGIGVNGIAFRGERLYAVVSDGACVVRVQVRRDGRAGALRVVYQDPALLSADGIAFDATGGLWITTNHGTTTASPAGGLFRLSPNGATLRTVADNPGWLDYPTMAVFGHGGHDGKTLYVDNGAYYSYNLDGTHPDIRALKVGVPGAPLH